MRTELQAYFTIERFEASEIDPSLFSHEAHIYVGWLYMSTFSRNEAIARFDAALRRLVEKCGVTNKYNAVVTWLFLLLIDERKQEGEHWSAFRTRNTDLFDGLPRAEAA